jgi:isochorismate hydrolase
MSTVVDLMQFKERGRGLPTLVLVDLHHDASDLMAICSSGSDTDAIVNCRRLLAHARANGFPVGFMRRLAAPPNPATTPVYPRWIEGFEPKRSDMIFDRWRPSCYASAPFAEMGECLSGNYVLAGQFGEMSCLSTAVDAFHRDHRPTFLTDALVIRGGDDISASAMQRAVAHIISLYADAKSTESWLRATTRRLRVRE